MMTRGTLRNSLIFLAPTRNITFFISSAYPLIILTTPSTSPLAAGLNTGRAIPTKEAPIANALAIITPSLIPPLAIIGKLVAHLTSAKLIAVLIPQSQNFNAIFLFSLSFAL
ncbi:111aa long hypothetical protein [Pyrococcus horikoshii OT3]|uniref:Uncharacterized protein n=1 Tax=Pyrococcus horikoshii (strain ATCC 700860 / DSM 12428 / JCM 9974 / NBRC 100139 / OT-3) TaxID=70601 RepID=O58894_PYRHO|nr:111aa long hypothetical protein [Pyrococcus horikoshii OT3]